MSASSIAGPTHPSSVTAPSSAVAPISTTCVATITLRRSTMSAMAPPKSPNSSAGAVLAVCTRATITGEVDSVAISHAATVVCIV